MSALGPFRADHVGSLLRPEELRDAREIALAEGGSLDALKSLEDRCIRQAVKLQEGVGLHSITDGDFRRTSFHFDFLGQLNGVEAKLAMTFGKAAAAADAGQPKVFRPPQIRITGKVRHARPIERASFEFLKSATTRTPKVTIPSPTMCLRGGRDAVSREAYPDLEAYYADVVTAYRAEIRSLYDAGCRYIQLDDTNFAYLCDPKMTDDMRQRGEDPAKLLDRYISLISGVVRDQPADLSICVHICRGNLHGRWAAEGGYEPVAERLFGDLPVHGYFLEYDSARAGGFEPLRFAKGGRKKVVLGLVSSKLADIEAPELIARRIDEAARHAPLDILCLSPQCGFASSFRGNQLGEDAERRKLELVVKAAEAVWGTVQ